MYMARREEAQQVQEGFRIDRKRADRDREWLSEDRSTRSTDGQNDPWGISAS